MEKATRALLAKTSSLGKKSECALLGKLQVYAGLDKLVAG
jgi:hypothetical protein